MDDNSDDEDDNDPVAAIPKHLSKTDLLAPASAATVKHMYFDRSCTLAVLSFKHVDLTVVLSRFMDLKEVASLSYFNDKVAYISEE